MMANAPATPTPSRARWKRLLLWSLAGVLLIPIALGTHDAVLSYNGFCFAQGRYLTDEERIRSAVEAILASYPRITYAYDVLPKPGYEVVRDKTRCCAQGDASRFDGSKGGTAIDASQLIPYRDIEEFFAVNPDCCRFAREGLYGELGSVDFWTRVGGYSAGFVSAKYRVRYRDADGKVRSKFSAVSWSFTACGEPTRLF